MNNISLIVPSRSNLKYLKWNYESVRNLYPDVEFCVASDYSQDGTEDWCKEVSEKDPNFKYIVNDGTWFSENNGEPSRMGHTLLYDVLINEVATKDFVMIWHADMYMLPNTLENLMKYAKSGRVISSTRIEPPLHPPGPEKHLVDCGIEPEEFNMELILKTNEALQREHENETTDGIFAPWVITKEDFQKIGGHDPLYAPQSKEDSDIFNRFVLAGYKLLQSRDSFCYHMTCRGSRFADGAKRNPNGEVFMKNRETDEWLAQNQRSTRNFIRKWGHFVKHDDLLHPIIPPKYNIGFVIDNCDYNILFACEPWCSNIYVGDDNLVRRYIKEEQKNTHYDLNKRVMVDWFSTDNDILVRFDAKKVTTQNFQVLVDLAQILEQSGQVGEMEYDIFRFEIKDMKRYEHELIICDGKYGELR